MKYFISLGIVCLFSFTFIAEKNRTIEGKITDENGKPVVGASVSIKGTKTAILTDTSGYFKIILPVDTVVLIFTCVGYEPRELALNGEQTVNITLKKTNAALSEVVVTGYTPQSNKLLTGAVASISTRNFTSPDLIQSKAAGVSISKKSTRRVQKNESFIDYDKYTYTDQQFNREGYDKITDNPFL